MTVVIAATILIALLVARAVRRFEMDMSDGA